MRLEDRREARIYAAPPGGIAFNVGRRDRWSARRGVAAFEPYSAGGDLRTDLRSWPDRRLVGGPIPQADNSMTDRYTVNGFCLSKAAIGAPPVT